MQKISLNHGSSVIEIIVAIGIFIIISSSVLILYLGSYGTTLRDTERLQADMLLQEGMEGVRSMRDYNYNSLVNGTHGLTDANGYWEFSGSSDVSGQFTRTITLADVSRNADCTIASGGGTLDVNSKKVITAITWDLEAGNTTSVFATEYLNNRNTQIGCGESSFLEVNVVGAYLQTYDPFPPDTFLQGITLKNLGASSITIDSIKGAWTNANTINDLQIASNSYWKSDGSVGSPTGSQLSGTLLDIANYTLPPSSGIIDLTYLGFDASMTGATFTLLFTMTDGTTRYVEIIPGPALADIIAPNAITNLALSNATSNSMLLTWTAPGDDGAMGTATSYDIRYSTSLITEGNWASATQVPGEPAPAVSGTTQSMTVSGLTSGTTYYFAIKTSDEVPNISGLSNVPSLATTQAGCNWANIAIRDTFNSVTNTHDAVKVQANGRYVYMVYTDSGQDAMDFAIVDVQATPTLLGSLNLQGSQKNIAISGNYAYIASDANAAELQIVDISNPNAPVAKGVYDAAGTANGKGVYVIGTTVYLVRDGGANPEFYIINASDPNSPTKIGQADLGNNTHGANEVYVSGNFAYVSSIANNQELKVVDSTNPASPVFVSNANYSYDIPADSSDGIGLTGFGNYVILGNATGKIYILETHITAPYVTYKSMYLGNDQVNDLALEEGNQVLFVASNNNVNEEFEIVDISNISSPVGFGALQNVAPFYGVGFAGGDSCTVYAVGGSATKTPEMWVLTAN